MLKQQPIPQTPAQEISSVVEYKPIIEKLLLQGLTPRPIFDRLRIEYPEFSGSYWAIKRLCRSLKKSQPISPEEVAIVVETEAGEIAQVGKMMCPKQKNFEMLMSS